MNDRPLMLICDDDPVRAQRWANTIERMPGTGRFHVRPFTGEELAAAVESLNRRRQAARSPAEGVDGDAKGFDDARAFDEAAIAIIDYDLTPSESTLKDERIGDAQRVRQYLRGRVGESIAYQARCFTSVGFLVVVNQRFQEQTFDVTMQRFADSSADLNVTQADLENPALWSGETSSNSFHPWSWPKLSEADRLWSRRVAATSLEAPVLRTLGLEDDIPRFSPRQLDLLGEQIDEGDRDLQEVTFDNVVKSSFGLDIRDEQSDLSQRKSIAASVVSRWLEQIVLPAQNVAADLPHIVARFPPILEDDSISQATMWQRLAVKDDKKVSIPPILREVPRVCEEFSSRVVWSAREVRDIIGRKPVPTDLPELVFCEDTSRFVPVEDAKEVETDVAGSHNRRFVEQVGGVRYDPLRRVL